MQVTEPLPDIATLLTGVAVVLVAVILWVGSSLLRGSSLELLEIVMFALVFAVVYFGSLSMLGRSRSADE